jgi:hypothetical protein
VVEPLTRDPKFWGSNPAVVGTGTLSLSIVTLDGTLYPGVDPIQNL